MHLKESPARRRGLEGICTRATTHTHHIVAQCVTKLPRRWKESNHRQVAPPLAATGLSLLNQDASPARFTLTASCCCEGCQLPSNENRPGLKTGGSPPHGLMSPNKEAGPPDQCGNSFHAAARHYVGRQTYDIQKPRSGTIPRESREAVVPVYACAWRPNNRSRSSAVRSHEHPANLAAVGHRFGLACYGGLDGAVGMACFRGGPRTRKAHMSRCGVRREKAKPKRSATASTPPSSLERTLESYSSAAPIIGVRPAGRHGWSIAAT